MCACHSILYLSTLSCEADNVNNSLYPLSWKKSLLHYTCIPHTLSILRHLYIIVSINTTTHITHFVKTRTQHLRVLLATFIIIRLSVYYIFIELINLNNLDCFYISYPGLSEFFMLTWYTLTLKYHEQK